LPLLDRRIFDDVRESVAIQLPQDALFVRCDCCSTGRVVQQSKLTKRFSGLVRLKERWLGVSLEDFGASERSGAHNVKAVALLALCNDSLILHDFALHTGANDDVLLFVVESREHESHTELISDRLGVFSRLLVARSFEVFLLVVTSKRLS